MVGGSCKFIFRSFGIPPFSKRPLIRKALPIGFSTTVVKSFNKIPLIFGRFSACNSYFVIGGSFVLSVKSIFILLIFLKK
ncbi:MAG: hypothetical protein CVU46_11750 [Chloroflexi bacterium HGW-Chloroflexi-8]|nr:MAG: hypothetical protein CVU46_11750 [Chloroflexi bacterium HGW-Chloroflexi-8]